MLLHIKTTRQSIFNAWYSDHQSLNPKYFLNTALIVFAEEGLRMWWSHHDHATKTAQLIGLKWQLVSKSSPALKREKNFFRVWMLSSGHNLSAYLCPCLSAFLSSFFSFSHCIYFRWCHLVNLLDYCQPFVAAVYSKSSSIFLSLSLSPSLCS